MAYGVGQESCIIMGHIVTGLAYYFASFDVTKQELEPLEPEFFNKVYVSVDTQFQDSLMLVR